MQNKFTQLNGEEDLILLEDTLFNVIQIKNKIIEYFEPKGNDLTFSANNTFIKRYFKQINIHGIFNRVEWKLTLKKGIRCDFLMTGKKVKQKGKLEIKIILEFSPSRKQASSIINDEMISNSLPSRDSKSLENVQTKVSLYFCPDEYEVKEILTSNKTKLTLNDICGMVQEDIYDQNSSHYNTTISEEIRLPTPQISMPKL